MPRDYILFMKKQLRGSIGGVFPQPNLAYDFFSYII